MSAKREFSPFELLLPYQRKIFLDKSKFILCLQSRQTGKSFTLAARAVFEAMLHPKSLTCVISVNERSAQEFLKKILQWAEACRTMSPQLVDFTSNASSVTFKNGSRVMTLPSTPASLRGFSGNIIWDEAAVCDNDLEMWAALLPIITSKMSGEKSICIASTPTSLDTVFAKLWHTDDKKWSKHKVNIYDAVSMGLKADPDEMKAAVNDDLIFQTEYMCEFASGAGSAFLPEWLRECEYDMLPEGGRYFLGYDVARRGDFSAFTTLYVKDDHVYIDNVVKVKDMPFDGQLDVLRKLNAQYKYAGGLIDATGIGSMVAETAHKSVSSKMNGLTFTAQNKTRLHDNLRTTMQNKCLHMRRELVELVMNDFAKVRRYISSSGHISYAAPHSPDGHADVTSSIVLALEASRATPVNLALPVAYSGFGSSFGSRTCRF